ncbi:hypothetical protein [Actinokineospora globicatena]|uniref:hypothetical protein n=1 Tax=Actinokineospora globicatena TaxID=103729 RepID=UPI0020A471D2|nr:hypothetical protein [Actinokineospora globicatena]MCP2300540.1 hypothetical protein [Actinokineospora globicatena]GLW81083.1 hypothetical protein Aglo01_55640 [Actinokineospora globicatena]GLW88276.1 hypothetical protein Aglo02_59150 [Actinokineospora globicatena]
MTADALADALRRGPFHVALRTAIEHRGLSLARLRAHLARIEVTVAESTLSYWQRGLRHPDMPHAMSAVRGLEIVLGLPVDSLVVLIGPRQRGSRPRKPSASFSELVVAGPTTRELLAQLGVDPERCNAGMELRMTHERVSIAADRTQGRIQTRLVSVAREPGIDRYIAVYHGEPDCDVARVRIVAGDGCRLGRVRRKGICVAFELMFDRRLAEGDTVVLSYSLDDNSELECPGYYRIFREPSGPFLLQLELPPDDLPARCVQEVRTNDMRPPLVSADLYCDRGYVVSAYYPGVDSGIAGITLEWSENPAEPVVHPVP